MENIYKCENGFYHYNNDSVGLTFNTERELKKYLEGQKLYNHIYDTFPGVNIKELQVYLIFFREKRLDTYIYKSEDSREYKKLRDIFSSIPAGNDLGYHSFNSMCETIINF